MSDEIDQPDPKDQEIASLKEQLKDQSQELSSLFDKHDKAMTFLVELSHATPVNGKVQAGWVTNAKVLIQELNA